MTESTASRCGLGINARRPDLLLKRYLGCLWWSNVGLYILLSMLYFFLCISLAAPMHI